MAEAVADALLSLSIEAYKMSQTCMTNVFAIIMSFHILEEHMEENDQARAHLRGGEVSDNEAVYESSLYVPLGTRWGNFTPHTRCGHRQPTYHG